MQTSVFIRSVATEIADKSFKMYKRTRPFP